MRKNRKQRKLEEEEKDKRVAEMYAEMIFTAANEMIIKPMKESRESLKSIENHLKKIAESKEYDANED